jgi:hypothetical protein
VQRRRRLTTRTSALAAVAVLAALALSACSPGADYPSIFPAVHDNIPPPPADTPMDANQLQQATEDLITDRDRLNAEAQGSGQAAANPPAAPKKPPAAGGVGGVGGTQTAGAESK